MELSTRKGLVHGIAACTVCGWNCEDYLTVQRQASAHATKTGHEVKAELGYIMSYGGAHKPRRR